MYLSSYFPLFRTFSTTSLRSQSHFVIIKRWSSCNACTRHLLGALVHASHDMIMQSENAGCWYEHQKAFVRDMRSMTDFLAVITEN